MKRIANQITYAGAGAGLVLFALVGLLPGSVLGGAMGLNLVGVLFGYPVTSALLPRLIVSASMLCGVMVTGLMFVVAFSLAGWLLGTVADALGAYAGHAVEEAVRANVKTRQ